MKRLAVLYKNEKIAFWTLVFVLSGLLSVYVYSLNVAVMNVVKRGVAEKEIAALGNTIGELESSYISLKKNINIELAYSLGYKEIDVTTYIARKSVSLANTFRAQE